MLHHFLALKKRKK